MPDTETQATPAQRKRDYSRLSFDEMALAFRLKDAGQNQLQIAQVLHCDNSTISRLFASFQDTRTLAKAKLQNSALTHAENVEKNANVEESLEVLDRLDVLAKKERASNAGGGVQVVVLMPGQTSVQPPLIDLSPGTFAPPCLESGQDK